MKKRGTGVLCVAGARPNLMKLAPLMAAFREGGQWPGARLVHTGQHYDEAMNGQFFAELSIPRPDVNLEVGSRSHATQTADIMRRFEPVLDEEQPACVLVVGDVNSTLACALVAAKKGIPVVHVEAGLRSHDRGMPEEINRVLTDQIADLLFATERSALDNLRREGIAEERVHFVGNVMIDTLHMNLPRAVSAAQTFAAAGAREAFSARAAQGYAVATLHRPSNVDDEGILGGLLETLRTIGRQLPVVFPLHPRTRSRIEAFGLARLLDSPDLLLLPPLGYLQMLGLMQGARLVLTDSGGIQEETTALGVPCLTLRHNTERPITVEEGSNRLAGQTPETILAAFREALAGGGRTGRVPEYWDGKASRRIAAILAEWLNGR